MTAVMDEVEEKKGSKRSRYRAAPDTSAPTGDILDDIGAGPQTAQEANAAYNEAVEEREEEENEALAWARSLEMTSIKFLGGKVYVEFKHGIKNFKAKTSAQSVGDVPTTFTEALNAMAPHVANMIFRDKDERFWQAQRIEVKGVNLKHHDEGNIHVGISFTLNLENGMQISACTPQMPLRSDNQETATHEKEGGTGVAVIEKFIAVTQTLLSKVEKTGNLFANQME